MRFTTQGKTEGAAKQDFLGLYGQVTKCIRWMPWRQKAMKDVEICEKLRGGDKQPLYPEVSEWGNPLSVSWVSATEYIGCRGERGELKHLSTRRKRNQPRFPK